MFWAAIIVATIGNTLGGIISYYMGMGAEKAYERWRESHPGNETRKRAGGRWHNLISTWLGKLGPAALLFSWLPVVGDPLCAVAGWVRTAFWPSVMYMAIGKFLRYLIMTTLLLWFFPNMA